MTWFKVDDHLAFHRKVLDAGNPAMGAWVRLGSWSSANETDGDLTGEIVKTIATPEEKSSLVRAGLIEPKDDGGYVMHDFLHYNPSSKKLKKLRKSWAGQKRRQRVVSTVDAPTDSPLDSSSSPSLARAHASGRDRDLRSESDPEGVQGEAEPETSYDLAARVWCELWQGRYGESFEVTFAAGNQGDDRILQRLGALALERGDKAEALLRRKITAYLADPGTGNWLEQKRHPLRFLERDWNNYADAKPKSLAVVKPVDDAPSPEEIAERKRQVEQRAIARAAQRDQREKINAELERDLARQRHS